jgi:hypothetical protein
MRNETEVKVKICTFCEIEEAWCHRCRKELKE